MKFRAADSVFTNTDGRVLLMRFTADQLVTSLHRHDALDDLRKRRAECFQGLVRQFVADGANDDAGDAAHDVRLVAALANLPQDRALLILRDTGLKDNNHDRIRSSMTKA